MKKDKVTMFAEESYNDLDDNIGIVMPILTDCDVDEDFTEGMEKVGEELPILPLRNMVLFPGVAMPVMIGRPKSMRLIKEAAHKKSLIGVVCQKDMDTEDPKIEDLYTTGVVADIVRVLEMPDGTTTVILQGKKRFQLEELSTYDPYLTGKIKLLEDIMPDKSDREFEALVSTIKDLTIKMLGATSEPPRDLIFSIRNNKNILYLINFSCCNVPNGSSEKQDLLLIGNLKDRAYRLLFILNREYQLVELKTSIQMKTHEDINQQQKEYFLQQQIKTIQEELGGNINELEIKELREKAARKKWPPAVAETFEKEVRKLERLHPQSPDFSIQTQYVQTIVNLPWNEYSKDNFNLAHAQKVLDRDHYGLEKVKERITDALEKTLSVDYDKNRLEQELIYYIEKLDVNEEKQRLSNHLKYFISTLESGNGQGKKLGFIAQEMGREINTLGSKSNHAEMQKIVVQMKDELEQIKEQVLNVM